MTSPTELLPCPFCGGEARLYGINRNRERAHIECSKLMCRVVGPPFVKDRDAIAAWNTRTAHSGEGRSNGAGEDVSHFDAFDMGYAFGLSLRGQTMEDSRAVGRLLWSDSFKPLHEHIKAVIDETGFNSFRSADNGIVQCKRIIRDAFARLATLTAPPTSEERLPADVVRLVIAAREIAFNDWDGDSEEWAVARKELDDASEAFASRVPWDDEPDHLKGHPQ